MSRNPESSGPRLRRRVAGALVLCLTLSGVARQPAFGVELLGRWQLTHDARDSSGHGRDAVNHGVSFDRQDGALFDGRQGWLEIPAERAPELGAQPFTISVHLHTAAELDDALGDILCWFDPKTRNGFNLGLLNYSGVTSAQSNWRNVFFGIDAGQGGET